MTSVSPSLMHVICVLAAAGLTACGTAEPEPVSSQPALTVAEKMDFIALGYNPAWSARAEGGQLRYTRPDMTATEGTPTSRVDSAAGIEFRGLGDSANLVLKVAEANCVDAITGERFKFSATFSDGERSLTGCARAAPSTG